MFRIPRSFVALGPLIVLAVLAIDAVLVGTCLLAIVGGNTEVERDLRTLALLDESLSILKDAESGQRGFLLTGREDYLATSADAESRLTKSLGALKALAGDRLELRGRIAEFEWLADVKLAEIRETIDLHRRGLRDDALELVRGDRGKIWMDEARRLIAAARLDEGAILARAIDGSRASVRRALATATLATGTALLLLIGVTHLQLREARERDRAASGLAESEVRKAAILETALDGIVSMDHEGTIVEWNPAAERIFGYGRSEAIGRSMADLIIPPALRVSHHRGLAQFLATGEGPILGRRIEVSALRRDGSEFPVELAVDRIPLDGPPLFTAHVRDISERKRAERDLLENERLFRTLADSIPQLAWMAGPDGSITWYNKRWYEYTGTTPDRVLGRGWRSVLDPAELPRVQDKFRAAVAAGEPWEDVFPLRRHDGAMRWHLSRALPVRDEQGNLALWFGTNTDVTDQRRAAEDLRRSAGELEEAKEEAEAANRAKDQFLAVLSHELRTPLNPILLAVTSMLERPTPSEEIRPNLQMIRQYVNLQSRLIDDLLDVMRIVRGKMPLHWEVADAHALIRQAIQVCRSEVFGKALNLEVDLAAAHHQINADAARLQQVFWNLIKNAVKFTPEGGTIQIRSCNEVDGLPDPGRLVLEFSDTGIGIEPDVLGRIFDPFQQGETSITRQFGGLGLGLAISKGIVEGHGGRISASSEGTGRGSTFRIELDILPAPAEGDDPRRRLARTESDADIEPLPPSTRTILLVEDEPATSRLMERLLRRLGHRVISAGTIAKAIEAESHFDFDLIVSDIGLPDGSGLELIRRVVARRGPVPAIALTGYGMEDDIQRSRAAGFTAHMTKPIDFAKLEAMIRQVAP